MAPSGNRAGKWLARGSGAGAMGYGDGWFMA